MLDSRSWITYAIWAALGIGLVFLGAKLNESDANMQLLVAEQRKIQVRLEQTEKRNSKLEQDLREEHKRTEELRSQASAARTIERFDPKSGHLVYREKSERASTLQKASAEAKVATKHSVETIAIETKRVENRTESTKTEIKMGDSRTNFAVGGIVTSRGAGPAASYAISSIGDKLHLDATVGVVSGNGFDPKAGLGVSGEVLPRLSLGVGAMLSKPGESVEWSPAAGSPVVVTPALTIQYRF